jgi:cysteine synthase
METDAMQLSPDVLNTIGHTPLIQLHKLVPEGSGRVVVKLEGANPTGSMKDRMALAMIEAAEADGRLKPGGAVIEFTGGSTGTSLAMVCAAKGYPLYIVTSNAASLEKRDHMRALGAKLTVLHSEGARLNKELYDALLATTQKMIGETGAFWANQFNNPDQVTGYRPLAREVWEQTGGQVDAFVHVVGTCGSLRGTSTTLREFNPRLQVVAVEPAESQVLSGGTPGGHRIEGVGIGIVPFLWDPALADSIEAVSTAEAEETARRLAREEAIFAGTSAGANVAVALRVAARLGPEATVATLLPDTGLKYLSTELYKEG